MKKARNREKVRSQWTTLESGPLARSETRKKGGKQRESQELVAHFKEWTTSSARNRENARKLGKSQELVDHFEEWTAGWVRNREKGPKTREKPETPPNKKAAGNAGRF